VEYIKVVFAGVQNAGKTTIINILSKKYSLNANLQPTKSVQREMTEVFGYTVVNWDIPGQLRLREELALKGPALRAANIIVFVFDGQDLEQTEPALNYFNKILKKISAEARQRPYIAIFIHKMDPDIEKDPKILQNVKKIQDTVKDIAIGFQVDYFLTSMFMEPTIYIAFSSVVQRILSQKRREALKAVLILFSKQLRLNALLLLDKNSFIVNHVERDETDLQILQEFAFLLISAYKNAKAHGLASDELSLRLNDLTFLLLPIEVDKNEIFIVGSTSDPQVSFLSAKNNIGLALKQALE